MRQAMTQVNIKNLNALVGKKVDYMAEEYRIKGWETEGETIVIATDHKPIVVDNDQVPMFLAGIIELAETNGVVVHQKRNQIVLQSVPQEAVISLSESLKSMVQEIAAAKSPEEIRAAKSKATAMSNVTNSLVNMAKLELETIKLGRSGK